MMDGFGVIGAGIVPAAAVTYGFGPGLVVGLLLGLVLRAGGRR
jgi:hypothetical protein